MKRLLTLSLFVIGSFVFNSCSKDPCDAIVCLNDGYCANGQCVCPPGYSGADCSQQVTPVQMRITKIEVTKFPATTSNGAGWDLGSGPDIYPELYLGNNFVWTSVNYFTNATQGQIYEFTPNTPIVLNNPSSEYTMRLYDYDDLDPDDFMGGIIFAPYRNNGNGFPKERVIDAGSNLAFKLHFTYIW